jgi:hypothetical protein
MQLGIGVVAAALAVPVVAACGNDEDSTTTPAATVEPTAAGTDAAATDAGSALVGETPAEQFPDVLAVTAAFDDGAGTWTFDVTISSPYDTPERYADGWRVIGPDGTVYGTHTLAHDHAGEQPFTRRQTGVAIPTGVDTVTVEGRDQVNGYGGTTATVTLEP